MLVNARWIVTTIRVMMLVLFCIYSADIISGWVFAVLQDRGLLADQLDFDFDQQPETWQLVVGFALDLLHLASMAAVFWSVHCFFIHFSRDQFFDQVTTTTIYRLGWSLFFVWFSIFFSDLMHLILIDPPETGERVSAIDFLPIDTEAIFLFLGLVFVAMAIILDEARQVDEENKEIV